MGRQARRLPAARLDEVAAAFADMVDLKTPFTLGHSTGVAQLATTTATQVGLDADSVERLRRAALVHDLGRVAVPNAVWEKPGALTTSQWEQVRLHAYHSERILARSPVLEPLADIAGRHHERHDGSNYHHVQHIYGKIGASTRAAAAMFAMQHGLLR